MSITERRHDPGSWSIKLRSDTPSDIIDLFDTAGPAGFGTIVITDGFRSGHDLDPTTLLALSRYTGVFRKRELATDGTWTIGGTGLLSLLGADADQASYVQVNSSSGSDDHRCETWASLIIEGGEVAPGHSWTHSPLNLRANPAPSPDPLVIYGITSPVDTRYLSRRDLLDWLTVQYPGVEYRVFPDATISIGPRASIYDDSVRPLVARGSGRDRATPGLPGVIGGTEDLDEYAYRVYVHRGSGNYAISDADQVRYRDPFGRDLKPARHIEAQIPTAWAEVYADALYGQTVEPHRTVTVNPTEDVADRDLLQVGGYLWVYAPELGVWNPSNGMLHRGGWVYPTGVRLEAMTTPVVAGMGVYFRWWPNSTAPLVADLTRYVVPETGTAVGLEVGSPLRPFRRRR